MAFDITLPLPPSVNSAYYHNHNRHMTFLSKAAKDWFEEVGWLLKGYKNLKTINDYVYLDLDFWLPRKNCDAHNYLKILCDGLQRCKVVSDDRYLMTRIQSVQFDTKSPRVAVRIVIPDPPGIDRDIKI